MTLQEAIIFYSFIQNADILSHISRNSFTITDSRISKFYLIYLKFNEVTLSCNKIVKTYVKTRDQCSLHKTTLTPQLMHSC